jgi:quinoprotein dehydrogenase-associated probable ABC transporter substrate-binding protein
MMRCFPALILLLAAAPVAAQDELGTGNLSPGREVGVLKVCADPDALPASSQKGDGYEIKIAQLIGEAWGWQVKYAWWPVRRGFFSRALNGRYCDVAITAPTGLDMAGVTRPYFRSSYQIVTRKDRNLKLASLADSAFKHLRIGVHILNSDAENTPPAMALSKYGVVGNLVGFTTFYSDIERPEAIFRALETDSIDVAIVWGPIAGYWVKHARVPLEMRPVAETEVDGIPFAYSMGMGVRRRDRAFRDSLQTVLDSRREAIQRILDEYGVPQLPLEPPAPPGGKGS